ncbi:hypothetical protein HDU85_006032 [Gaertneriomyces sp. JEL0708]|nr:hypothetical protein HDU85_006032 [Gaertneriomyces sp. JEL0708]
MLSLLSVDKFLASRHDAVWRDYVAHVDMVLATLHEQQAEFPDIVDSRVWREKKDRVLAAKTKGRYFEKRKKLLEVVNVYVDLSTLTLTSPLTQEQSQEPDAIQRLAWESVSRVAGAASQAADAVTQAAGAVSQVAGSLQPLVETCPSKRPRSSSLPIPDMPGGRVLAREGSPQSVASYSQSWDADDLCEWRQRMVDSLAALKVQEVMLNGVDAAKVLRKYQKVLLDSHREEASIEVKHSEMFLAVHGCLLLTTKMPSAYHSCVTEADYRKLVAHFSQRKLPPVDMESLVSIAPVVRSMAVAVQEKRRVAKHILPFMPLRRSEDIAYDVDATTEYSNMRPAVVLKLGEHCTHPNRAISSWELKTPGASAVEKAKDLGRVINSCIQYLKSEHDQYVGELTLQYKLAVYFPGRQGTVYEVYLLPKMFIAVEIRSVTLPVSLESCEEIPVATAIRQMEIYFERVRELKEYMLHDTVRAAGSGGRLLPPTPSKKTTAKPRSTKVAGRVGSSDST